MERVEINRLFLDMGNEIAHRIVKRAHHFVVHSDVLIQKYYDQKYLPNTKADYLGELILPYEDTLIEFQFDYFKDFILVSKKKNEAFCIGLRGVYGEKDGDGIYAWIISLQMFKDGQWFRPIKYLRNHLFARSNDEILKDTDKEGWRVFPQTVWEHLLMFIELTNHPSHSVVQRFPKEKKNDVNWVLSRSHYLIIDNDESKTISHSGVSRSFDGQITRAMHARRAHFRTLKAEIYGANIGKRIWVKSAWVGPREWEGTDQKIYRVVNTTKIGEPIKTQINTENSLTLLGIS